jgi:hypothetical protein
VDLPAGREVASSTTTIADADVDAAVVAAPVDRMAAAMLPRAVEVTRLNRDRIADPAVETDKWIVVASRVAVAVLTVDNVVRSRNAACNRMNHVALKS